MSNAIKIGHAQGTGRRLEQQDSFGIGARDDEAFVGHAGLLAMVADGVGGHSHGKGASETAVHAFLRSYQSKLRHEAIPDALHRAMLAANHAVCEFAQGQGAHEDCGTTLAVAVLHPPSHTLYWISVGDSRLYLLRGKALVQVTMDGNYANYLRRRVAQDTLTRYERRPDVDPLSLTSFLGMKELGEIDRSIRPFAWREDDWLMLCTDGIYNALDAGEMLECLVGMPQDACDRLVSAAQEKGQRHQDNATVVIFAAQPREMPEPRAQPAAAPTEAARPRLMKPLLWGLVALVSMALAAWLGLGVSTQLPVEQPETGASEVLVPVPLPDPAPVVPAPSPEPPSIGARPQRRMKDAHR